MTVYSDQLQRDSTEIIVVDPISIASIIIRGLFSADLFVKQAKPSRVTIEPVGRQFTKTATVVEITKIVFPSKYYIGFIFCGFKFIIINKEKAITYLQ
jgi:hypothetical protein